MTESLEIVSEDVTNFYNVTHVSVDQNLRTFVDNNPVSGNTRTAMVIAALMLQPDRVLSFEETIESTRNISDQNLRPTQRQIAEAAKPIQSPIGLNVVVVGQRFDEGVCVFIADTTDDDNLKDIKDQIEVVKPEIMDKYEEKLFDKIVRSKVLYETENDPVDLEILDLAQIVLKLLEPRGHNKSTLLHQIRNGELGGLDHLSSFLDRSLSWLERTERIKRSTIGVNDRGIDITGYVLADYDDPQLSQESSAKTLDTSPNISTLTMLEREARIPTVKSFMLAALQIPRDQILTFEQITGYFRNNIDSSNEKSRIDEAFYTLVNYGYFQETEVNGTFRRTSAQPSKK